MPSCNATLSSSFLPFQIARKFPIIVSVLSPPELLAFFNSDRFSFSHSSCFAAAVAWSCGSVDEPVVGDCAVPSAYISNLAIRDATEFVEAELVLICCFLVSLCTWLLLLEVLTAWESGSLAAMREMVAEVTWGFGTYLGVGVGVAVVPPRCWAAM